MFEGGNLTLSDQAVPEAGFFLNIGKTFLNSEAGGQVLYIFCMTDTKAQTGGASTDP